MNVKTFKEYKELGVIPDILFWVGCAGSYDDRAKKITKSLINLFKDTSFALLICFGLYFFIQRLIV